VIVQSPPLLRWAGGKAGLVRRLLPLLPWNVRQTTYFEPFIGAGSLYFAIKPSHSVLGDENHELIDCYDRVGTRPDLVWRHLIALIPNRSSDDYYKYRREFNELSDSHRRAALFIYLNKMCFNGIWRVNRAGNFNVPFGGKERPGFPTRKELNNYADALSGAILHKADFEVTLQTAQEGDFVYLDPPYLPLSSTAFFRHYTSNRFSPEDHERVALVASQLASVGANIMITEGDSEIVRKWYREFHIHPVAVRRSISCGTQRVAAQELIITSY
jgi:DNA adenine methylase